MIRRTLADLLEPFVAYADTWHEDEPDETVIVEAIDEDDVELTLGDFRRLAAFPPHPVQGGEEVAEALIKEARQHCEWMIGAQSPAKMDAVTIDLLDRLAATLARLAIAPAQSGEE